MISTAERIKTNWLLLDDLDMWDEFIIKKNDEKHVKNYYSQIKNIIDEQLQASVNWLDSPEAKRFFYNEAKYSQEVFESLDNEWDKIINGKYSTIDELLDEFYNTGKQKGYSDIRSRIRFTEADRLALTFTKNYNFHLIRKLSNDLKSSVKNKIIKSAIGGENPNKLANELLKLGIKPLPNMTLSAKQRAVMIAKTETSRIQNTGILQSYVNEGYTEVTILTSEDDHVCYTCLRIAYEFNKDDEVIYSNNAGERTHNIRKMLKSGNYPPFHPNCRCTVLPVWKTKGEPPENPYTVELTPNNYLPNYILNRLYDREFLSNLDGFNDDDWDIDNIKKSIKGVVDDNEIDDVANVIYDFIQNAKGHSKEGLTTYDKNFNEISKFIPGGDERFVDVPNDDVKQVKKSYFGIVGHSHTKSKIPLPSCDDIKVGILNLNVKYNIIYAPGFGVILIKKSDPFGMPDKKDLKESYNEANRKRNNYVNSNITRATDEYKNEIKGNFNISMSQQINEINAIKDSVRHSNLKEQCEFYNEELNQYGIELKYITP